jgi:hypothetical protein
MIIIITGISIGLLFMLMLGRVNKRFSEDFADKMLKSFMARHKSEYERTKI